MHATQSHQILPDESAELITSWNERSRDDGAVEPREGSTPEAQVEKLLPCSTPNDGLYGRVHSEVSDARLDTQIRLLNANVVHISATRRFT